MARSSGSPPSRGSRWRASEPPNRGSAEQDAEPDPASIAREIALRRLAAAPRSRAQLEGAMARRQVPADVAAHVLDRLTEVGLVDDAAYAELLVRSRHAQRGLARRALAHELRAKGIDREVAEQALEGLEPEQERSRALALVTRRAPATAGMDRQLRRRRLAGMLARKGYSSGLAVAVVDEVLGREAADNASGNDAEDFASDAHDTGVDVPDADT